MDQILTSEEREKIYDDLADVTIDALKRGLLTEEESQKLARFILDRLDKVKNYLELDSFFADLCSQWKIFEGVYLKFKEKLFKISEQIKINQLTQKLNQFIKN